MTIQLNDAVGLWYVQMSERSDWLGAVMKQDGKVVIKYRFRYYLDDKNWDSADRKNWYAFSGPLKTLPDAVAKMQQITQIMAERLGGERYELLRAEDESDAAYSQRLAMMPWSHMFIEGRA